MLNLNKKTTATLLSLSILSIPAHAEDPVFNFTSVYEKEISWNNILNASLNMDFNFATELLIQKSKNENKLSQLAVKFLEKATPKINELINSNKSAEEKKNSILRLIDKSFLSYSSAPAGQHGLSLKYSPSFGVTKLIWNSKTINQKCDVYSQLVTVVDPVTGKFTLAPRVTTTYGKIHPDIRIFRKINGIESEIVKINGNIQATTYELSDSITENAKSLWSYYQNNQLDLQQGQEIFTDFDTLNLKKGDRVSYRILSDFSQRTYKECGSYDTFSSTAILEDNGDGNPDFIPEIVYAEKPVLNLSTDQISKRLSLGADTFDQNISASVQGGIPNYTYDVIYKSGYNFKTTIDQTTGAINFNDYLDPYCGSSNKSIFVNSTYSIVAKGFNGISSDEKTLNIKIERVRKNDKRCD